jgi:hypothetical protein
VKYPIPLIPKLSHLFDLLQANLKNGKSLPGGGVYSHPPA